MTVTKAKAIAAATKEWEKRNCTPINNMQPVVIEVKGCPDFKGETHYAFRFASIERKIGEATTYSLGGEDRPCTSATIVWTALEKYNRKKKQSFVIIKGVKYHNIVRAEELTIGTRIIWKDGSERIVKAVEPDTVASVIITIEGATDNFAVKRKVQKDQAIALAK